MATLGAFDPELRREALFDPTLVAVGWFDPELIDTGGGVGSATPGIRLALAPAATVTVSAAATPGIQLALAPSIVPPDTAATILDYATLGPINGASGGSMSGHLLYAVNTGRWWFFTYGTVLASGTATGGTNQTLVDSGAAFTTALNGRSVVIVAGTGAGNAFEVTRSSATTLRLQNNGDPATPATLTFTPDSTSQYVVVDSRKIRAYVSSSSDLSTATWAAATGSASADMTNGVGVDMAGGRFDGGAFGGTYPTDGRQLAVTYADVAGHDIAYAIAQVGVHWFKISNRARLTAATTIAWDNNSSNTNPWDDGYGAQEALPYATQPFALAFDTNNSRWHVVWNKTQGLAGSAWVSNENGTLTQTPAWGGYIQTDTFDVVTDNNSTHYPWEMGLCELASGIMLAVYCYGNAPGGTFSTTAATQTGLRFTKSSSATAWPTVNTTGAAVPSLSATANSPNDWAMVQRTTTDVHIVRRNSATVLEHIRYDGTTWGSVTTLPTSGLTGHVANSGIGLATDGTTVWCVALDSDANNSIKYLTWTAGGGWASSWTTLSTNGNAKAFLAVHQRVGNNQVGVAWTEGPDGSGRYTVRAAPIAVAVGASVTSTPGIQVALAPAATTLAPASATPGIQVALAPAATGVSLASATPGISLALAPAATGVSLATATPGVQLALAPAATSLSVATATPGMQLALAPLGTGISFATTTPGIQVALAPQATGVSLATATPGIQLALAPTSGAPAATATPGISLGLAAAAIGISLATSAPGVQLALTPAATGISFATSTLGISLGLTPAATGVSLATSTPGIQVALAPQATAIALATAAPGISLALAPLTGGAVVTTTPGLQLALVPAATGVSLATATPGLQLALAPQATGTSFASATPGLQLALAPQATGVSLATAAPGIQLALAPATAAGASVAATPGVRLALTPAATSLSLATATPGLTLALAPVGVGVSLASATLGIQLGLASAAVPAVSATPGIRLGLVATATALVAAASAPGVQLALTPQGIAVTFATAIPGLRLSLVVEQVLFIATSVRISDRASGGATLSDRPAGSVAVADREG
jgi:hypothetical protein